MTTALIGYTGFVGSTLLRQAAFDDLYNSANVHELDGRSYELIVCAAAPAEKWRANKFPDEDWRSISTLIEHLERTTAERMVLISTVDVYAQPQGVDEDADVRETELQPYGKHRHELERAARRHFPSLAVVRLPGLFGHRLKKNFLYDLIHRGASETNPESVFQFYNMQRLWLDLTVTLQHGLDLVNLPTEPVPAARIARYCVGINLPAETSTPVVRYDMYTKHAALFGGTGHYIETGASVLDQIKAFAADEREHFPV